MHEPDRRQVDAILKRALELRGAARLEFLDTVCGEDAALREMLERLLESGESDQPLLTSGDSAAGPLWAALASEQAQAPEPRPGDQVGAYRIREILGRGGMAVVYLAERAGGEFEQTVALKVLSAARYSGDAARRFSQERQILATLEHPNIARLIDGGTTGDGQQYVVMEYVDGIPIDRYCDENRLSIRERIELFERVARAIEYAHARLIVHRDLKPSNILVANDGEPKLLDFGIAKLLDPGLASPAPETRDAMHPMTPEYASPEQLRGEPLTTASDVYQLGFLLYRLLTGRTPYPVDGQNIARLVQVVCTVDAQLPSRAAIDDSPEAADSAETRAELRRATPERLRKRLSGDLDNILLAALRKSPERRYASVLHLREDLRRHLDGLPVSARQPTVRYRATKFVARNRIAVAGALMALIAVTAGVVATAWQARETAREAQRAEAALEFLVGLFESTDPDVTMGQSISAQALLDRGRDRLDADATMTPAMRAEMLSVIGNMYAEIGRYDESLPLLEKARTLFVDLRSNDRHAMRNADRLAMVLLELGRYDDAAAVAEQVVHERRENPATTLVELSTSVGNLASIRSMQGSFDEAGALYGEVLQLDRRAADDPLLASHLSDYSASLYRAGEYEPARQAGEESLLLHRNLYGPAHTLIATSLLNLGTVYMDLGDYDRAEELLRECLSMRRQLLGTEHPHVAIALSNLGHLLRQAGRLDEAEDAHRDALAIRRSSLGPEHPDVANTMNHIGVVLYFDGRYADAADVFEEVIVLWRKVYGPRHPNVFSALNNLGAASREAGDFERAERVLRETLELRREAFGESHRQVAQSMNNLALLLAKRGANDEAENLMRDAIDMWRETMGEEHPDVADGLMSLGNFLLDQDRCAEAEAPLRESHRIREQTLDAAAPMLASSRLYLGECLLKLDRGDEAAPLLNASLPVLVEQWGDDAEITQRARSALSRLGDGRVELEAGQ